MANTTSDKLSRLLNTKAKIKNAIVSAGITIPDGTVFNDYSDYSDVFWNRERLSRQLKKTDAVTVACALQHLKDL